MRWSAAVAISVLLGSSLLQAQVSAPGTWERLDALQPGTLIVITLKSGAPVTGAFQASGSGDLAVTTRTGTEQRVAKAEIQGVVGEKKDSVMDGLLLGAAIGAGTGAFWGYGRRSFECRAGCAMAMGTIVGTPIGALVGWLRDRKHHQTEVLYRAP